MRAHRARGTRRCRPRCASAPAAALAALACAPVLPSGCAAKLESHQPVRRGRDDNSPKKASPCRLGGPMMTRPVRMTGLRPVTDAFASLSPRAFHGSCWKAVHCHFGRTLRSMSALWPTIRATQEVSPTMCRRQPASHRREHALACWRGSARAATPQPAAQPRRAPGARGRWRARGRPRRTTRLHPVSSNVYCRGVASADNAARGCIRCSAFW